MKKHAKKNRPTTEWDTARYSGWNSVAVTKAQYSKTPCWNFYVGFGNDENDHSATYEIYHLPNGKWLVENGWNRTTFPGKISAIRAIMLSAV